MNRMYQRLSLALILLMGLVLGPGVAAAQEPIQVVDQAVDANFRDHITFTLDAKSPADIVEVDLLYQVVGQIASSRNKAEFTPGKSVKAEFKIDGMTCTSCAEHVQHDVNKLPGIILATASYENNNAIVEFDNSKTTLADIQKAIDGTGYKVIDAKIK